MNAKPKASSTSPPPKGSMTALLRQAIVDSDKPMLVIAKETGLDRASLTRFRDGERSLRLDKADILAAYFGLETKPAKRKE